MTPATLDPGLAALLGRVWPRLPLGVARAEALGYGWAAVSTPFVRREGAHVVGHVGVIELPLVAAGQLFRVGSLHAVCTDPDRRGRGVARALMNEALAACDARFETLVLGTLIPDFYTAFGFRRVAEHAFSRPLPPPAHGPSAGGQALDTGPASLGLLHRLLAERAPVSARLGSREEGTCGLMLRSPLPVEGQAFMLPPLSRT